MSGNDERYTGILRELVATYLEQESNRTSMVTVTRTELSHDKRTVTFLVSVFPEAMEEVALAFLNRKRSECRDYIKKHARLKRIPFIQFAIDEGEKKRRRVDELLAE